MLEPDELVGVRLYDEGGRLLYVPALYLRLLHNKDAAHVAFKLLEAGALGVGLGAWTLAGAGVEASTLARVLTWCDRTAYVLGTVSSLLLEHRGWLIQRFGDQGRAFVFGVEAMNSAMALYGVARVAMTVPRLVKGVRAFYQQLVQQARVQRELGQLTAQETAGLDALQRNMGEVFAGLDAVRDFRGANGVDVGKAGPPQSGGNVITFDRARKAAPPPNADAQPIPVQAEEPLAATGTDGRLVPLQPQRGSGSSPTASLQHPGQGGPQPAAPAPPTARPAPSNTVRSVQSPPAPRPATAGEASKEAPRPAETSEPEAKSPPLVGSEAEPGEWVAVTEHMSDDARLYQAQVTGRPPGQAYVVKNVKMPDGTMTEVKYDGFTGPEFQECKGPGYKQFLDPESPGHFYRWFEDTQRKEGMVRQAIRQMAAANGRPVRWYVAEPEAAAAIRELLNVNNAGKVEVIYRPMLR